MSEYLDEAIRRYFQRLGKAQSGLFGKRGFDSTVVRAFQTDDMSLDKRRARFGASSTFEGEGQLQASDD